MRNKIKGILLMCPGMLFVFFALAISFQEYNMSIKESMIAAAVFIIAIFLFISIIGTFVYGVHLIEKGEDS